jgi:CRISPR-associated endonuclease/helicase Cas3
MHDESSQFVKFFKTATGFEPFPYQRRLALDHGVHSALMDIPTGLGKTEAVLTAWLWNRVHLKREDWPRRLVYCLPMRVLVEQTRDRAVLLLRRLDLLGGEATVCRKGGKEQVEDYTPSWKEDGKVTVTVLMGGEEKDEWDIHPERDAIVIGTQDMLLSRALNRGYGMSRYRWPIVFGLLNNDCLWVVDEGQLMRGGLATTCQMQAFREALGTIGPVETVWMSATVEPGWLKTVDFDPAHAGNAPLGLTDEDLKTESLSVRWNARKPVQRAKVVMGDSIGLAKTVVNAHQAGSLTLVVVNTVQRAQEVAREMRKLGPRADVVLVHSRFRPPDREAALRRLLSAPDEVGTIGVTTQVIEAGVDLSARSLFTEVAPWASLVQRFGRCNRFGLDGRAAIHWVDLPEEASQQDKWALPYPIEAMRASVQVLASLEDGGPRSLKGERQHFENPPEGQVVRLKDLLELFDTTPDLAGNDTDISRFVRETERSDLRVFWRSLGKGPPGEDTRPPSKDELCPAPLHELRQIIESGGRAYLWESRDEEWQPLRKSDPLHSGSTVMLVAADGRYTQTDGWSPAEKKPVPFVNSKADREGSDSSSVSDWLDLAVHTDQVVARTSLIASALALSDEMKRAVMDGARWHDAGKAHPAFQANLDPAHPPPSEVQLAAKAPKGAWRTGRAPARPKPEDPRRRHFRHELASGLLALDADKGDLASYLAASHHGKVRLSIRSFPGEDGPDSMGVRFARGVWDGDRVPGAHLGGGVSFPESTLDLSLMELGRGTKGSSWVSRMLSLRDDPKLGPFRLALLEAVVKSADERASGGKP